MKKKIVSSLLVLSMFGMCFLPTAAFAEGEQIDTRAKSAVLMCSDTGEMLYENNSHEKLAPASVTKVMSMLLIVEAIDGGKIKLSDQVTASKDACAKGGSQIWLKENETMTVEELLKATAVASANDACCALGEKIAGSEAEFVKLMNLRAKELGMNDTNFENCSGLDDTAENHYTSAYDIAIMSKELINHQMIKQYTTIWMDNLRDGKTELTNTNKLVRFYDGATGLKTGTTAKAGSCLSATATRDGLSLVAVVMGCVTSDDRFEGAKALLNYGFANYELYTPIVDKALLKEMPVKGGVKKSVTPDAKAMKPFLVKKGQSEKVEQKANIPENVTAPVEKGQVLGDVSFAVEGKEIKKVKLVSNVNIEKNSITVAFAQFLSLIVA